MNCQELKEEIIFAFLCQGFSIIPEFDVKKVGNDLIVYFCKDEMSMKVTDYNQDTFGRLLNRMKIIWFQEAVDKYGKVDEKVIHNIINKHIM